MPGKGKQPSIERRLHAKDIRERPIGTKVYLIWWDRVFGEMRAKYELIGNNQMRSVILPDVVLEIKDYDGKRYEIAGDEKSWEERRIEGMTGSGKRKRNSTRT